MKEFLKDIIKPLCVILVVITIISCIFFIPPFFNECCDKISVGVSYDTPPVFPDGSIEQSSSKWIVSDRHTYSSSRSSSVRYYLDLTNSEGETDSVSVSMEEFVEAKDGQTCYTYRYITRPYHTYSERLGEWLSGLWVIMLLLSIIPIGASTFLIVDELLYQFEYGIFRKNKI